jgi:hypothetical protein
MSCGINHRVGIKASPKEIYKASTLDTDNSTQNAPSSTCPRGDPEWIVGKSESTRLFGEKSLSPGTPVRNCRSWLLSRGSNFDDFQP